MMALAASVANETSARLVYLFVVVFVGYMLLSLLTRRIGGKGGGSEKASVAAWFLIIAVILGVFLAAR